MGRLWFAATLGAAVGKERSTGNHHAAGVRTMALVSLGSAGFTLCSLYGFGPPGRYDVSRMASAVASGIGFIGAGVITTTTTNNRSVDANDEQSLLSSNESCVHGLTTAAAVWISAAVGVTCATGLYILATSLAAATLGFLRIGGAAKRQSLQRQYQDLASQIDAKPELLWYYLMNRANVTLPMEMSELEDRSPAGKTFISNREDQTQTFGTSRSQQETPPIEYNDLDFSRELSYGKDTVVAHGSPHSGESIYKSSKIFSEDREYEQPLDSASRPSKEICDSKPKRTERKLQSSAREKPLSFANKTIDTEPQELRQEVRRRRSRFEEEEEEDDDKPAP
jgi:putative Mg2+ transporter-C (MgtC) family protein